MELDLLPKYVGSGYAKNTLDGKKTEQQRGFFPHRCIATTE